MSIYQNHIATAAYFDRTRRPVGVETVFGCLAGAGTPLNRQTVLDAGCGTGAYTADLLSQVAAVISVDADQGMLAAATDRLAGVPDGRIRIERAHLEELPVGSAGVDGALVNQVLHHLPDRDAVRRALAELARAVRPGGTLVIGTSSRAQVRRGFWHHALLEPALPRLDGRLVDPDDLATLLDEAGFCLRDRIVPLNAVLQGDAYFDAEGPLHEEWRRADATWELLTADELGDVLDRVRALQREGDLEAFRDRHDQERREIGQVTFCYAQRA